MASPTKTSPTRTSTAKADQAKAGQAKADQARTGQARPAQRSRGAKRGGNLVSILINAALLILLNVAPGWQAVPFLTSATAQVIGLVNLTLWAGIVANAVYFVAEPRWLRAAGDLVTLTISLITTIRILEVFPFAFNGSMAFWSAVVRVLLVIGIVGSGIGILYSLVTLLRSLVRAGR